MKTLLAIILILFFIFCLYIGHRWDKMLDEYFETPRFKLPDEITIKIVKEKPARPSAGQNEPSSESAEKVPYSSSGSLVEKEVSTSD